MTLYQNNFNMTLSQNNNIPFLLILDKNNILNYNLDATWQ